MFIAVLKQRGEGCDYTIECGVKVVQLKSQTWEAAIEEAHWEIAWEYRDEYHALESLEVFEVAQRYEAPIDEWYAGFDDAEAAQEAEDAKEQRRLQYERLKREFEGK